MEFVTPVITAVVDSLMVRVKKHMGFFFFSTEHVRNMSEKLLELSEAKHDMEERKKDALINDRHIPDRLPRWLEQVEEITEKMKNIPIGGNACLNLKIRYKAGKSSFYLVEEIDDLLEKQSKIQWSDKQRPLGMVVKSSTEQSTSEVIHDDHGAQNMFSSRQLIYNDVLKSLEPDSNFPKIALCGMGGVGKTTLMEELEKGAKKKGMFKWVLKAVVGEKHDVIAIQQAIAQRIGEPLTETTRDARADRLGEKFEGMSESGTNKILVILDDVWEEIDLKNIGLKSPLPDGLKVLITSRNEKLCSKMGIENVSIFKVVGLEKAEAKVLFWETVTHGNCELHDIGEDILNKCGGLPMAIKTIALTLIGEEKYAWEDALVRLQRHDHEDLYAIMEDIFYISYSKLRNEDKSVFILCGLFPDDSNIAREELMRYGWGLQLFQKLHSLTEARHRTNTCVSNLIHANLLNESDLVGHVRMHDLARAFVLSNFSKFKQASIVSNGDESEWPMGDTRESCERVLVDCSGMYEFPQYFDYPNLSLLKLVNGDELLKFPKDFHKRMEKLEVIAYDQMKHPLRVESLCYSTSLRTLCLHSCPLEDNDISFLGNLVNLEVLSLAQCGIRKLPSTIMNLKRLKLLDLTGCVDLCIDDGVFQNLDKLEELYMKVFEGKGIKFADVNRKELETLLPKLYALEVEFFENVLQWKKVSFKKLQRFRISMGCFLDTDTNDKYSLKNTMKLVTKCSDLHECKITELFSKTEELSFSVKDMSCFQDISVSPSQQATFCRLKVLHIFECADLTNLFTISVAKGLKQLESLTVSSCPLLKSLVSLCDNVNILELPQLVELTLYDLPNFTSIILKNDISTSQPLFSKEIVVPKLSKLTVGSMKNLKEIWACDITSGEEDSFSMLREIEVNDCESVVNFFPRNPMRLLKHLEELRVARCCSIEALFNMEVNEQPSSNTSNLRTIKVEQLEELREVWRINNENNSGLLFSGFQSVKTINISRCKKFRNVFTPTTANFDMGALLDMTINECGEDNVKLVNSSQEEEITIISKMQEISKVNEHMPIVAFSSYTFNQLRKINFERYGVEVVFEIQSPTTNRELLTTQQLLLLPYLNKLRLWNMNVMSHVWKCGNWNEFFKIHQHQTQHSFQNLTAIELVRCNSIRYLFSPRMSKLLSSLKILDICYGECMEEVVSNRDDDDYDDALITPTNSLFPCLDYMSLAYLDNLKHIGGGISDGKTNVVHDQLKLSHVDVVSWSLCQYSREIYIGSCKVLSSVVPSYAAGQMNKLQNLKIHDCSSMAEVFETNEINDNNISDCSSKADQRISTVPRIPKTKSITIHNLSNLKSLKISSCDLLKYTFTFSTLESLRKLENVSICFCGAMEMIVREENGEASTKKEVVVFPSLKSIELDALPKLEGFCLGLNINFQFPSLENVKINSCPQMRVFTSGESTAPELKYIHTSLGKHNVEGGLNFHGIAPPSSYTSSVCPAAQATPWSFNNFIEMNLSCNDELEKVVQSFEMVELQNLEMLSVYMCHNVEEVFEVTNNETQTVVKFPKLREVDFNYLDNLKYIWKSIQGSKLEFPTLTKLSIKDCNSLEHAFTTSMVGSLIQLRELDIVFCRHMEVIVKKEEEEERDVKTGKIMFPCLEFLRLEHLSSLECIWERNQWSILEFPSLTRLSINSCNSLEHVFTTSMLGSLMQLQELVIYFCNHMEVIVKKEEEEECDGKLSEIEFTCLEFLRLGHLSSLKYIWKSNQWSILEFPNLTRVIINDCQSLEHVFTTSMVSSLMQLQELHVKECSHMEVIVKKEEDCDVKMGEIKFPCLKFLKLEDLSSLEGFCLGKEDFLFPLMNTLVIKRCPKLRIFSEGRSIAPELKLVKTSSGLFDAGQDINSFIVAKKQEGFSFGGTEIETCIVM